MPARACRKTGSKKTSGPSSNKRSRSHRRFHPPRRAMGFRLRCDRPTKMVEVSTQESKPVVVTLLVHSPTGLEGPVSELPVLVTLSPDEYRMREKTGGWQRVLLGLTHDEFYRMNHRDVRPLVRQVKESLLKLAVSESTREIAQALVLPFLCRNSLREEWMSKEDMCRILSSIAISAKQIESFQDGYNSEQKYVNYHLNLLLHRVMRDPTPPPQVDRFAKLPLFTGYLRIGVQRAVFHRDVTFIYSLSKGCKTVFPTVRAGTINEATLKNMKCLSETNRPRIGDGLRMKLYECASEIFNSQPTRKGYRPPYSGGVVNPVVRATYDNPRKNLGQLGLFQPMETRSIRQSAQHVKLRSVVAMPRGWERSVSTSLDYSPHLRPPFMEGPPQIGGYRFNYGYEVRPALEGYGNYGDLKEHMVDPIPLKAPPILERGFTTYKVEHSALQILVRSLETYRKSVHQRAQDKFAIDMLRKSSGLGTTPTTMDRIKMIQLCEPSKVRTISVQCGYMNLLLQPTQRVLINRWKSQVCSTMRDPDCSRQVSRIAGLKLPPTFKLWANGDYSAATDKLKAEATDICLSALDRHDYPEKDLAIISFAPKWAECGLATSYTPEFKDGPIKTLMTDLEAGGHRWKKKTKRFRQSEGQLMGHPLSFPFLCACNKACYLRTVDIYLQRHPEFECYRAELELNIIINGDDIVFRSDAEFYKIFEEVTLDMGFEFSPGKNYLSDRFAMINSQIYEVISLENIKRRGYLNQRITVGVNPTDNTPVAVATEINKDIALTPWLRCLIPLCFEKFRPFEQKSNFIPNWYLPQTLGGYGLNLRFSPPSLKISKEQRKVAAWFINNPTAGLFYKVGAKMPKVSARSPIKYRWESSESVFDREVNGVEDDSSCEDVTDPFIGAINCASNYGFEGDGCGRSDDLATDYGQVLRNLREGKFTPVSTEVPTNTRVTSECDDTSNYNKEIGSKKYGWKSLNPRDYARYDPCSLDTIAEYMSKRIVATKGPTLPQGVVYRVRDQVLNSQMNRMATDVLRRLG